ncbi:vitamin K epoxide reductase family protein [Phycisphaerales bacterium AB-hyl4]|uniref:Vitamin K epoxide reductase family protein n=1 Tax=Natronomicrosphaera hydrolytica TaxID=3242702 RepID=A0ABV4UAB9_9BACT
MNDSAIQPGPYERPLLWAVRLPAFGALAIGAFLFYESVASAGGVSLPGCGPGSGCDAVLSSRWAYWLGVPVAGPAMGIYALLLAMSWQVGRGRPTDQRRLAAGVMAGAAMAAAGAAVWFIVLQAVVIEAMCAYCMTVHALGMIAAVLTGAVLWQGGALNGRGLGVGAAAAVVGVGVLVGGQLAVPPETTRVLTGSGVVSDTGPGGARTLTLMQGESGVMLTPHDQPVLGSADAEVLLVYLFDYTCAHCRVLHRQLEVVRDWAEGRLAVVMLPVPLDAACHPMYDETPSVHADACELARVALAVWQADASQFETFDHWMTATDETRTLEAARARAAELVGDEALEAALAEAWVQEQPGRNVAVHMLGGAGPLPQLVGPWLWMQGRPASAEQLWDDLSPMLGIETTER